MVGKQVSNVRPLSPSPSRPPRRASCSSLTVQHVGDHGGHAADLLLDLEDLGVGGHQLDLFKKLGGGEGKRLAKGGVEAMGAPSPPRPWRENASKGPCPHAHMPKPGAPPVTQALPAAPGRAHRGWAGTERGKRTGHSLRCPLARRSRGKTGPARLGTLQALLGDPGSGEISPHVPSWGRRRPW